MNIEELKNNVGNLSQITAQLEAAVTELEVRGCTLCSLCKIGVLVTTKMYLI